MRRLASLLPASLKPWLWRRLSGLMHLEYRLPSGLSAKICSYSDWCIYNDVFVAGEYDSAIQAALEQAKGRPAFRVVDLGANVGFFTLRVLDLMARQNYIFAQVDGLLVEASPRLLPSLNRHLAGVDPVKFTMKIVIGLVGLRSGEGHLSLKSSECMNQVGDTPTDDSRRVAYYNLDEVLGDSPEIDLLKCDIEGSEREFLEHYSDLLRKTKVAVIEFHEPKCPASFGITKVKEAGFTHHRILLDQGHATTVLFER